MSTTALERINFEPRCLATTIGSLPHKDADQGTRLVFASTPEIPSWSQFPKRDPRENMMIQFTEGLPGLVTRGERTYVDTTGPDFVDQLTAFYEGYLLAIEGGDQAALEGFGISNDYAAGFGQFEAHLQDRANLDPCIMLKGQVTGPFTLGTNLLDQDRRCTYYDAQLRDVIVSMVTLKALWQIHRLALFGRPVMIFLDEPSLLGFGSQAFITVSREDILTDLNRVTGAIHEAGALAGVHCEANTDWSLLMETDLDVLDFDAYDHMQAIALYPAELGRFLRRGGWLGWGIVPTLDPKAAAEASVPALAARFTAGLEQLTAKGVDQERLVRQALITPSCGAGGVLSEALAERVLGLLRQLSSELRQRYGFASS